MVGVWQGCWLKTTSSCFVCFSKYLTSKDPQNYHGEGDEGDEGDEAGEHHREEQACEGDRVPRAQDEDREWAHQGGPVQEQARKEREPQAELRREEAVLVDAWAVDLCGDEGAEGIELEGVRCGQREDRAGPGLVREGEVLVFEVSSMSE